MYSSTLNNILLALCLGSTVSAQMPEANPAAAAGGNEAAATADPTCAQAMILSQGIALNIADQQQELATANQLMTILSANPVDTAAYGAARTNLLKFVNNGIAIRQMNQLITPPQNKATAGVAIVANAQLTELGLSTNLTMTGTDNLAGNMAIVKMLQMNFAGGIQQNMKNMADAMAGCGATGGAATPAAPAAAAPAGEAAAPAAAASNATTTGEGVGAAAPKEPATGPAGGEAAPKAAPSEAPKAAASEPPKAAGAAAGEANNSTAKGTGAGAGEGAGAKKPEKRGADGPVSLNFKIGVVTERPTRMNSRFARVFAA